MIYLEFDAEPPACKLNKGSLQQQQMGQPEHVYLPDFHSKPWIINLNKIEEENEVEKHAFISPRGEDFYGTLYCKYIVEV
jgi:hypothetical protein